MPALEIPAPITRPIPPVSEADRRRISYFGLHVEAPAPSPAVEGPEPARRPAAEHDAGPADVWVNVTPHVSVRQAATPGRTDSRPDSPRGLIECEGPRPTVHDSYVPTRWELDLAASIFTPPARRTTRYNPDVDPITDLDAWPRGVC